MTREKLKAIERAVQEKTGRGIDYPTILYQDDDGLFYDFATVGKVDIEPVELDPQVRHQGGNHYMLAGGVDNRELLAWLEENPQVMFDYRGY